MRFQVGDIVRIAKSSEYYGTGVSNPKDTEGKITSFDGGWGFASHEIQVDWDNGCFNNYSESDLKLRRRDSTTPLFARYRFGTSTSTGDSTW